MAGVNASITLYLRFLEMLRTKMAECNTNDKCKNFFFLFLLFFPYIWNVFVWAPSLIFSGFMDLLLLPVTCSHMYFCLTKTNVQYMKTIASIFQGLTGRDQRKINQEISSEIIKID
jgi:hypothetical protein